MIPGNPIKYLGHDLTWEKGRQLKSFDSNTYTYNANGIRTSKTINGVKHTYTLDGVKILRETWGDNTLIPLYDNEASVCGILYNDTPYYFLKNLQGDIIAITNQNGQTVAKYRYDAWGKCTVTSDTSGSNIPGINPFRYRGYYYDPEIGMYYLQSRYYDPTIGRFVNSDDAAWLFDSMATDKNLFAYCKNACVNTTDELGYGGIESLLEALSKAIDVVKGIVEMIGNSFNKERDTLMKSVKLLSKKQRKALSAIKDIQKDVKKISKRLGWVGYVLSFFAVLAGVIGSIKSSAGVDRTVSDLIAELCVLMVEEGAGDLFAKIANKFPYFGFLLGIIGSWVISYLLKKYFSASREKKIKKNLYSRIIKERLNFKSWLTCCVKSLTA